MFDYYFATIFFSVFLMVIMKIMVVNNALLDKKVKKKLDIIATIVIITSLAEWSGVKLDGGPVWSRPLHIFVKMSELSLAPAIPVLCADVIAKIKWKKPIFILLGIQAGLEILSGIFGFIYHVDQRNAYSHASFYWIYALSFLAGILMFTITALNQGVRQYGLRRILLLMLPAFALCGLFFQYFGEGIRVIWLCVAIDVMLMYCLYQELTQNTYALTNLLNRRYYESRISRQRSSVAIYYFDVDDFKHANDTYGHSFGDICLARAGRVIQDVFGKNGTCYRIGGDEFCAILDIPKEEAEKYIEKFKEELKKRKKGMAGLPDISVGYAYYEYGKDNIMDTVKEADAMMYRAKRLSKEQGENG